MLRGKMGSVKVDLHGKEMFYKDLTLSDIDVVQLLIEFRYKYDKYAGFETNNFFQEAGEVADVNQEAIATYAALDVLIEECKFTKEQMKILKMIEQGYIMKEIADELGLISEDNIRQRLNKIIRDITKANERNWRKIIYVNKLDLKTKGCSKCKEMLPATNEFFSDDLRNKEGLHSMCKSCRK